MMHFQKVRKTWRPWAVRLPPDLPFPVTVRTAEGEVTAQPGDYLLIDSRGELYPCEFGEFQSTYEVIE